MRARASRVSARCRPRPTAARAAALFTAIAAELASCFCGRTVHPVAKQCFIQRPGLHGAPVLSQAAGGRPPASGRRLPRRAAEGDRREPDPVPDGPLGQLWGMLGDDDINRRGSVILIVAAALNVYLFSPLVSAETRALKICPWGKEFERSYSSDPKRAAQREDKRVLQDPDCVPLSEWLDAVF